jgi:hypothetical protein
MERRPLLKSLVAGLPLLIASCRDSGTAPVTGGDVPSDSAFIGLTEKEGADRAEAEGLRHRVISVDGQPRPATKDYRPDRINFEIVNGRIAAVTRG